MSEVYFIQQGNFPLIKIGWALDAEQRCRGLQCGSPHDLRVLCVVPGPPQLERRMHRRFAQWRARSEWFFASPDLLTMVAAVQSDPEEARRLLEDWERDRGDHHAAWAKKEAELAKSIRRDIIELRDKVGIDQASQITGLQPQSIANIVDGKTLPRLIVVLRIWEFDREAMRRTRSLLGIKLVPLSLRSERTAEPIRVTKEGAYQ